MVRRSRLVESLLAISSSLRFVVACHTGTYFPLIVSLQSGVQRHRSFTVYDVQSHHVTFFSFGVQSHFSSCRRSEPPSLFSFGVQSHHHFLVSAFKAITVFSVRRSESLSLLLSFDIQSHRYHFSVSAVRAIIGFQIDVQSHILGFGVQSHYHFSV